MSNYVNGFTLKSVYILYIPSLVNCVSFRVVVLPYQQFKVLKSNNI